MSVPTYIGTVPSRSQTQVDFDENVQDMLDFIGGTGEDDFIPALNAAVSGLASTEVVLASAHFIGPWSSQTGAHDVPTSVSHDDKYWMLLSDTLDITSIEPGVSADWQEIRTTGELPRVSEYLTENIQGLEYSYNSTDTINIEKGNCYDSTGSTVLTLPADTTATIISPAINTTYNIFVTDAGDIQFDSDVDGTTLLAGSVNQLRWIGFVLTDASGNIVQFTARGDMYDYVVVVGYATGAVAMGFSLAPFLPVSRCLACTVSMNISSYWGMILNSTSHSSLESYYRSSDDGGISATVVPDNNGEIWAYATVSRGVVVTSVLLQR